MVKASRSLRPIRRNTPQLASTGYRRALRYEEGCAEGDCGACSVVISDTSLNDEPMWRVVNSCILFLPALHGRESLPLRVSPKCELHPTQTAMVELNGSQCGYCTPGFMMTLAEAAHRDDLDEPGNFTVTWQQPLSLHRLSPKRKPQSDRRLTAVRPNVRTAPKGRNKPSPLEHQADSTAFWRPKALKELLHLKSIHPEALLLSGGTDLGLLKTKRHQPLPQLMPLRVSLSCVHSRLARRNST